MEAESAIQEARNQSTDCVGSRGGFVVQEHYVTIPECFNVQTLKNFLAAGTLEIPWINRPEYGLASLGYGV
jgi:hypothetical protein